MKNAIGRQIPETIRGIKQFRLYGGEFTALPKHTGTARTIRISLPHTNKLLASIEEAIKNSVEGWNDDFVPSSFAQW